MDLTAEKELTLRDLTVIYRRRQKSIYGVVALLLIVAAIYCIFSTRRFEATSTIQVQSKSQDGLGLDSITSGTAETDADALSMNINIQTQANILQSDSLALKTIEDLHLEGTEDFRGHWNPINWALGLLSPSGVPDPSHASLEDSPQRRRRVLQVFSRYLSVKPVSGTRLLNINYLNPNPKLAAAVVNKLTQSLIDYSFQTRFDASSQASSWLNNQLGDLRRQSEQLEKHVAELESKSNLYNLGTVDPEGHAQSYSGVLEQLKQATTALNQAEQNRILRGAIAHAAADGDAELLSGLAGNAGGGGTTSNTLALIQNLRGQEATQRAALQQAEAKYGESYPKLDEYRGNIAGLEHSIQEEVERLKGRARSDYSVATQAESGIRSQYDKIKSQADALNDKSVALAILRQEADQSRKLYLELLTKFKEADALAGMKGSTITVVDPGRIPGKPKKPNIPLYLTIAVGSGFVLGCCVALVIDTMDSTINTIGEAKRLTGDRLLGVTPIFPTSIPSKFGSAPPLAALEDSQSPFIEAIRSIRTAIFLLGHEVPSKVILITSSVPGEGKTVVSSNLAVLLSRSNKKVLLIDMDLRQGTVAEQLNLSAGEGLSELLGGQAREPRIHSVAGLPTLDALTAGAAPANPFELLSSNSFARWLAVWRDKYDYIVLDSASLLPASDSLTLAPLSDITLLIARCGLTERSQLSRSFQLLTHNSKQFVSVVLNGLRPHEEGYSSYFGSSNS